MFISNGRETNMKRLFLFVFLWIFIFVGAVSAEDFIQWDAATNAEGYYVNFTDGTTMWYSGALGNVLEVSMATWNLPYKIPLTFTVVAYTVAGETEADPITWTQTGFTPPGQSFPPPGQVKPENPGNPKIEKR